MSRIGPGAAGTVKALWLVHRQQRPGTFELDALLPQRSRSGAQGTPPAGRGIIRCEYRFSVQLTIRKFGRGGRGRRLVGHDRSIGNRSPVCSLGSAESILDWDQVNGG